MYIIGLTGSIASGKSTLANFFEEEGAIIIDADKISHDLLSEPKTKNHLIKIFGNAILDNKKIDRKKLAKIVFSSKERLDDLDKIMWPLIIGVIRDELKLYSRTLPPNEIVVIDAPLLFEAGLAQDTNFIIFVATNKKNQLKRLLAKGFSEENARLRIKMQTSKEKIENKCDYVIENNTDLNFLRNEAEKLWHLIKKQNV